MLNKKRKKTCDKFESEKRCKLDKKGKYNLDLFNSILKKTKIIMKNYILMDSNYLILYGLL